jgi:predicted Zn-dependent peptidase
MNKANWSRPLALALLLMGLASPQARASPLDRARQLTLENGLRVILIPRASTPLVASTVIVQAGSRFEPAELAGATHFLEHLLFNGTRRRTQRQLYDDIDRIGAYLNASTRADMTIFQLLVHRDHLAEGLDIQADMLFNSILPPEKFEKERGIVIEEIAQSRDRPQAEAERFFTETVFASTPYERAVLGTPDSIRTLQRQAVWDYYRSFYQPANMTLVLMGGIDVSRATQILRSTFGQAPAGKPPPRPEPVELRLEGQRLVGRKAPTSQTYLTLTFAAPGLSDPDYPAFALLVGLLNAGTTSRLERLFRSPKTPSVYRVEAGVTPTREAPVFTISAGLPPEEDSLAAVEILLDELRAVASGKLSPEELELAKKQLHSREVFLAENILYYAFFQASYLAFASLDWVKSFSRRIQQVTAKEVVALARKTFEEKPFVVTLFGPEVPEGTHSWRSLAPKARIQPSGAVQATYEPRLEGELVEKKLANGLRVIVRAVPETEVFALHLMARNRSLLEPESKAGIAELLHRMLPEGTVHRSADQIARDLQAIGARLKVTDDPSIPYDDYYWSPEYSYIRLEVAEDFALEALANLAELVFYPSFPPDAFQREKQKLLNLIRQRSRSARYKARRLLRKALFGDSPLARPLLGTERSVESITIEDLRAFHRLYFSPENLLLTVVGPRPAREVLGWIEFLFGREPSTSRPKRSWPPLTPRPKGQEIDQRAGRAQSFLYMGQVLQVPHGEQEAFQVMNALLSDRLSFELREKRGLAYWVGSGIHQTQAGWYFVAGLGTQEASLAKARRAIAEIIGDVQSKPPGQEELTKTVNGLIGASYRRRLTAINQAYFLALDALRGRPLDSIRLWEERLKGVRPEDVRQAALALRPEEMVVVTVRAPGLP